MIIFDNEKKTLEVPVGLGNLEVTITEKVPYSAGTNIDITEHVISCTIDPEELVESAITSANTYTDNQTATTYDAATAYTDSAISQATANTYNAASAYTDSAVEDMIKNETDGTSTIVSMIWAGTQEEYDALTTTGATTLYIITV